MSDTTRPTASPAHAVEDLAFLRDLAESGRDAPFGGGDYLIAGGGWFALASLIVWAGAQGFFGLGLPSAHLAWVIAAAVVAASFMTAAVVAVGLTVAAGQGSRSGASGRVKSWTGLPEACGRWTTRRTC